MTNSEEIDLEMLRFEHERALQHEKFQSESGHAAARGAFLLNGAAVVAILAFMGDVIGKPETHNIGNLTASLWYFVGGIVCAVFCHGAGNFWHRYKVENNKSLARLNERGTYVFWVASLALAIVGAVKAANALTTL